MLVLSQNAITLISTIIGIFTASTPFLLTNIYNDLFKYSYLNIEVNPNFGEAKIQVSNIGTKPANNIWLTVLAPDFIASIDATFSSANLTLPDFNHNLNESF